jgi:hypothetical protein
MIILTPYTATRIAQLLRVPPSHADAAERQQLIELLDPPEVEAEKPRSRLEAVNP